MIEKSILKKLKKMLTNTPLKIETNSAMKNTVIIIFLALSYISCQNIDHKQNTNGEQLDLPFIGTKYFETRPTVSGKWTPHRKVEIREDGNVKFSFSTHNYEDSLVGFENYDAGKFKIPLKCVFKEWDNETRFYEIGVDKIIEVDSNGKRLLLEECCDSVSSMKCSCEALFEDYSDQTW